MVVFVEDKMDRPAVLKQKYQIGCTTAPMNYPLKQAVFHVKDIPADKLAAKHWVQDSLKSKILSHDKLNWNSATSTGEKICSRRTYVNSVLNRSNMFVYNYRAEKLPSSYPLLRPKANKFNTGILEVMLNNVDPGETFNDERIARGISKQIQELPNHPDLMGKELWNISSDVTAPIHHEKFKEFEIARTANSEKATQRLKSYEGVIERYQRKLENQRKQKLDTRNYKHNQLSRMEASKGLYDRLIAEKERQEVPVEDDTTE